MSPCLIWFLPVMVASLSDACAALRCAALRCAALCCAVLCCAYSVMPAGQSALLMFLAFAAAGLCILLGCMGLPKLSQGEDKTTVAFLLSRRTNGATVICSTRDY